MGRNCNKINAIAQFLTSKPLVFFLILGSIGVGGCNRLEQTSIASPKPTSVASPKPSPTQSPPAPDATTPSLGLPIDCQLDRDCYILHYVDRDPDPKEEVDFNCGRQTYDGHSGTDFGVPDERAMEQGVEVLASADGTVLRVRDGQPDRRATDTQVEEVQEQGLECGNGMVIDHGNGWETQYCHLRKGSVAVREGTQVKKGDVLGMVGLSGMTQFPHVHLSVRHNGKEVDPFVGDSQEVGCQVERRPMWDRPLAYDPTGLISAGFSMVQPTFDDVWAGRFDDIEVSQKSPALIFWVHAYGILKGDTQRFRMFDPNGREFLNQETELDAPHRTWLSFVGKRNTSDKPIIPGTWRGEYQLKRGNEVIFTVEKSIEVK